MGENTMKKFAAPLLLLLALSGAAHADEVRSISVPPGDLTAALESLAKQAGIELIYHSDELKGMRTNGVKGTLSARQAVEKLLEGTRLTLSTDTATGAMLIATPGIQKSATEKKQAEGADRPLVIAQSRPREGEEAASRIGPNENKDSATAEALSEVLVTGSRLRSSINDIAPLVRTYGSDQIARSGQTNISDFLNTLPSVSISITPGGTAGQTFAGAASVSLRGLPIGTTLVLINGRRVESSGSQAYQDFFDLNNIPLSAVDRIEVATNGSSAIYGSDAIAGVVDVVLKRQFSGFEGTINYGAADKTDDRGTSLAFGRSWDRGGFSLIGHYQSTSSLSVSDRKLTESNDFTRFGGTDNNFPVCRLGNAFSLDGNPLPGAPLGSGATYAAYSTTQGGSAPRLDDFQYGLLNRCSILGGIALIPQMHRRALYFTGNVQLTSSAELFTELLYSDVEVSQDTGYPLLFGDEGFQTFTMAARNPFNPFGVDVGVSQQLTSIQNRYITDTKFFRPLLGAKGSLANSWSWEVSAWQSEDRTRNPQKNAITDSAAIQNALNSSDPNVALNPFAPPASGSQTLLQSFYSDGLRKFKGRMVSAQAVARGNAMHLPAGDLEIALGAEYDKATTVIDNVNDGFNPPGSGNVFHRKVSAAFVEARIPILSAPNNTRLADRLSLTVAARHDDYDDAGAKTTPQFSLSWHPTGEVLVRGSYGKAFKAPSLTDLHIPNTRFSTGVVDPQTGENVFVTQVSGGNPDLVPLTGISRVFDVFYSPERFSGLRLSASHWHITENDAIQPIDAQFLVDHEATFPEHVIRDANGNLQEVFTTRVNFGSIDIAGLDYQVAHRAETAWGTWSPAVSATQVYRYRNALVAGGPVLDAAGRAQGVAWAPRWKGSAQLAWERRDLSASIAGRYVGSYVDYDGQRTLGNFWIFDTNLRLKAGESLASSNQLLRRSYVEFGAVNLFNELPQYSSFGGLVGYDPTQADIRGRFLYARLGMKW